MSTDPLPEDPPIEDSATPEVIEQAREYGWKAPEEWAGAPPPQGFLTPDEYLEKPLVQAKIAQAQVSKLEERLTEKEVEFRTSLDRTERMYKESADRRREAHERELQGLRDERRLAAEVGDMEKFDALDKREVELVRQAEPQVEGVPQTVQDWGAKNTWFGKDPMATAYARAIAGQVAQDGGDALKQVEAAEKEVRKRFPEIFPEAPKPRQQKVDGGGLAGLGGKSIADNLPPEAREQMESDIKDGLFESREEWAEIYFEGDA